MIGCGEHINKQHNESNNMNFFLAPGVLYRANDPVPGTSVSNSAVKIDYVAFGNGMFYAHGYSGATGYSSTDGTNWTARANYNGVTAFLPTPNLFLLVGGPGNLARTSPDGVTWTTVTGATAPVYPTMTTLARYAANDDGSIIVVVGYYYNSVPTPKTTTAVIYTSINGGVTWASRASPVASEEFMGVAYGNGKFITTSYTNGSGTTGGTANAMYSTNGSTWLALASALDISGAGVSYANGLWFSTGGGIKVSADNGVTWADATSIDQGGYVRNIQSICWSGTAYYSMPMWFGVATPGTVMTSTDGYNWTPFTTITIPAASAQSPGNMVYGNGVLVLAYPAGVVTVTV
jgi:hypothetical protein